MNNVEQVDLSVDTSLEGIKLTLDRQLYPSADMARKMGVKRVTRGGIVMMPQSQVEALIRMAEQNENRGRSST